MNFRHKLIIPSSYLAIGMCGVYLATYQISLLQISQTFGLGPLWMGILVAIQYVGLCLPPLFLGTLSERIGKKGVVTIALPLMILGTLLISLTASLWVFIIGILLCGAGYSVAEATLTATLGVEFREKSAFHLGLSQAIFSIGAVLSPYWCEALYNTGQTYHLAFGIVSAALIVTYILFLFTKQKNDIKGRTQAGVGSALRFFKQKTFLLIAIAIFTVVGVEETTAFYADSYLELTLGIPQFSALALSLFWAGMILPRLLLGAIKLPYKTLFMICGAGIAVSALAIVFIPVTEVRLALFAMLGIFNGPTWPAIMDIVAKRYPDDAGAVSNVMMSVASLGGAVTPLIAGALVVGVNFAPIFFAVTCCGVVMAIAFALTDRRHMAHKNT